MNSRRVLVRLLTLLWAAGSVAYADVGSVSNEADAIIARVEAGRALRDFSMKARLFGRAGQPQPVEILMKNTTNETRTIYQVGGQALLVIQPVGAPVRLFLRGRGELTGAERLTPFGNSEFTCYELGLPFLRWPQRRLVGTDRTRGQDCWVIEATATGEPYARVKLWIAQEYAALLRAEAYDADGRLCKRLAITSFKRVGDVWLPRGMEAATVPVGQALPATEKSRLEIYEVDERRVLPMEWFVPERFVPEPPVEPASGPCTN